MLRHVKVLKIYTVSEDQVFIFTPFQGECSVQGYSVSLASRWYLVESEHLNFASGNALIRRNNAARTCKIKGKEKLHVVQHKYEPLVHGAEFVLVFWGARCLLLLALSLRRQELVPLVFWIEGSLQLTAVQGDTLNVDLNMQMFLWPAHHFLQEFFSSFRFIKLKCTEWKNNSK